MMTYQRKTEDTLGLTSSIDNVWNAIPRVLKSLDWKIESTDLAMHRVKAKAKATSMLAGGSTLLIEVSAIDANNSKVQILSETGGQLPFYMDRRTKKRVEVFFEALHTEMMKV